MTKEELKTKILEIIPAATFDETGEWLNVMIEANDWLLLAQQLRNNSELDFDFLFSVTGVDWKTHFSIVYHLRSLQHGHIVVVKAKCDRANPEIESVCQIWQTAELNEREVFDLFGIKFLHHPDLRRLFLTDEWEGYPLRKDYVDEVNMIKL
jgi:NADH-quinone oxidoreductase subunit C